MPHGWWRAARFALLPALLAGCASFAPQAAIPHSAAVAPYQSTIQLGGRLSVQYRQDNQSQFATGSFSWNQSPDAITVDFFSPFGQELARIVLDEGGARLLRGKAPPIQSRNIDDLTIQVLGLPFPLSHLKNWLQGYARAASGQPFVASPEHADVITADGWRLRYVGWQNTPDQPGVLHPRRIDLTRDTEAYGKVEIRIVLNDWQP